MKAKEYVEKYGDQIVNADLYTSNVAIASLISDLYRGELKAIVASRKINTDRAFIAAIKELNQKWNSIANQLEEVYDRPILVRNGFNHFVLSQLPELKGRIPDSGGITRNAD